MPLTIFPLASLKTTEAALPTALAFNLVNVGRSGKYVDKIKIMLSYPMLFFWKYRENFQFMFILLVLLEVRLAKYVNRHRVILGSHFDTKDGKDRPTHRPPNSAKKQQKLPRMSDELSMHFPPYEAPWLEATALDCIELVQRGLS